MRESLKDIPIFTREQMPIFAPKPMNLLGV
jgi:hypothetical protein